MPLFSKSAVTAALIAGAVIVPSSFNPVQAQVVPPPNALTLPDVDVQGRRGPNPGHYSVPAGYGSNVAMHPYTSGFGPCPEGAAPSQGCHHPTGHPIPPSHYEQPPVTR